MATIPTVRLSTRRRLDDLSSELLVLIFEQVLYTTFGQLLCTRIPTYHYIVLALGRRQFSTPQTT